MDETSPRLDDHFPFPAVRPRQAATFDWLRPWNESRKKFAILEGPTGYGKSGIAIAEASFAKVMPGYGRFQPGAYILTPQKTLAMQYMRDFAGMGLVELRGRANYTCRKWTDRTGAEVNCEDGATMNEAELDEAEGTTSCDACEYRRAKEEFCERPFGTTNFSYYLHETRFAGELLDRNVLVLDEGHSTGEQVLALAATEIDQRRCRDYGVAGKLPEFDAGDHEAVLAWLDRSFMPAASAHLYGLQKQAKASADVAVRARFLKKASAVDNFIMKLGMFRSSERPAEWFTWTDSQSGNLMVKPLTARLFADELLFSKAQKVLIMSATILDFPTFMRNLGIDPANASCLAVDSDFPLDNRPIYYRPVGDMRYADIDRTLPLMAAEVERLLRQYGKHKGIIHTNSYKVNKYMLEYLTSAGLGPRLVTHDSGKGSREAAQAAHTASSEPTVLMSPSMTEGLDLKDELARFGITCKVPSPSLDPYPKARMRLDPDWYQWQTGLKLVQGTGRINRHKDDKAHNWILDAGFSKFIQQNNRKLPAWWTESIHFL